MCEVGRPQNPTDGNLVGAPQSDQIHMRTEAQRAKLLFFPFRFGNSCESRSESNPVRDCCEKEHMSLGNINRTNVNQYVYEGLLACQFENNSAAH